jgi:LytS/YehU family sensor histidine kinase
MSNTNEKIIQQKEELAAQALQVAEDSLELLRDQLNDCSTRDLVQVFNSAIKAHREIVSDIVSLSTEVESKQEKALAREYNSTMENLLKRLNPNSGS